MQKLPKSVDIRGISGFYRLESQFIGQFTGSVEMYKSIPP